MHFRYSSDAVTDDPVKKCFMKGILEKELVACFFCGISEPFFTAVRLKFCGANLKLRKYFIRYLSL